MGVIEPSQQNTKTIALIELFVEQNNGADQAYSDRLRIHFIYFLAVAVGVILTPVAVTPDQ